MKEAYCVAHGDVQGVFYRKYLQEKARAAGITGYAKNIEDGAVEVIAQGPEDKVRAFLEFVYSGPEEAAVDSVEVQWGPVTEQYSQFDVL